MTTYDENLLKKQTIKKKSKKNDFSFFVPMGQESLNFKFHEFSSYFL